MKVAGKLTTITAVTEKHLLSTIHLPTYLTMLFARFLSDNGGIRLTLLRTSFALLTTALS